MARGGTSEQAARTRFRDVFAVAEFRALWLAQLLSIIGDQFARVALTVLVFDRTRSALLAAVTFVVSVIPTFIGGITLAWLADRHPRRAVMILCDLIRCALVLLMAVPGVPLGGLIALLFVVTLTGAPFTSARAAIYPDVLDGEQYVLGTAIGLTTVQFAQVVGFAAGGTVVGFFGTRTSLVIDAATFALSGLIVQSRVRPRPALAPAARLGEGPTGLAGVLAGTRLVFSNRMLRTTMLFGWLAAFYNAPEGVVTPLAREVGGGALAVGVILAAQALGETAGVIVFSRFVPPAARLGYMGPLAVATCGVLVLFAWRPGLLMSLLVLAVSGICASYQLAANSGFVSAAPPEQRGQAFGLAQGGISLGQGIVMIAAGAAADRHSPALVIAVCGAVGAVLAVVLALSWRQGRRRVSGRHERALLPVHQVHCSPRIAYSFPAAGSGVVLAAQVHCSPRMSRSFLLVTDGLAGPPGARSTARRAYLSSLWVLEWIHYVTSLNVPIRYAVQSLRRVGDWLFRWAKGPSSGVVATHCGARPSSRGTLYGLPEISDLLW